MYHCKFLIMEKKATVKQSNQLFLSVVQPVIPHSDGYRNTERLKSQNKIVILKKKTVYS